MSIFHNSAIVVGSLAMVIKIDYYGSNRMNNLIFKIFLMVHGKCVAMGVLKNRSYGEIRQNLHEGSQLGDGLENHGHWSMSSVKSPAKGTNLSSKLPTVTFAE